MKRIRTRKGASPSPRTSATTPGSKTKPSSSAIPTTSRSGSPRAGGATSRASKARSLTTSRISGSDRGTPAGGDRDHSDGRLHEPVLLAEVLAQLDPREGGRFLDGTVGAGGHAEAILERTGRTGQLIGLDVEPAALAESRRVLSRFGERAVLVRSNFALLDVVAREHGLAPLDGILLDLGLSSLQLADERRGFSFRAEGPLDMRADPDLSVTAADIVNSWDERELRRAFGELGEETEAGRVAAAIVRRRTRGPFLAADDPGRFVAGVNGRRRRGT